MAYDTIRLTFDDAVAIITLNRPERLNAVLPTTFDEIADALDQVPDARAVLLQGEGRAFCAGADVAAREARTGSPGEGSYRTLTDHYNPGILRLAAFDRPIVSAVTGPAAGIGCALALAADLVVIGTGGYFLQAFANIGLIADGGASWTLTRLIGRSRAAQMMLLGERIYGPQAVEWGLAYKCVEDDAVKAEALALAQRLAAGPTLALGLMRCNLVAALDNDLSAALAREADGQRIAGDSADAREGGRAFLEKRKPAFIGR